MASRRIPFSGSRLCPHSPFTPCHGLDGFLGKVALGLSIASNDPSYVVPRAKCWRVNEKIISRAVLELDDELAVSVCCHGTFLANLNRQRPARPGLFHVQTPSERRELPGQTGSFLGPHAASRNALRNARATIAISLKRGARNPSDLLGHDKKPRRSGAKSAMWAAEKGGGNAAHNETLPLKRLSAQAGNVIQLRCKPTSRQFSFGLAHEKARRSGASCGSRLQTCWAEENPRGPASPPHQNTVSAKGPGQRWKRVGGGRRQEDRTVRRLHGGAQNRTVEISGVDWALVPPLSAVEIWAGNGARGRGMRYAFWHFSLPGVDRARKYRRFHWRRMPISA